jgi:excisionase family DNA binding protein
MGIVANAAVVADNATRKEVLQMAGRTIGSIDPGDIDAEVADRAARRIRDYLEGHPEEDLIEVLGEVGVDDALVIPRPTAVLFAQILDALAKGQGVQIIPKAAELTTQQAADMLNVSRPYLITLLESRQIPFRRVGRHRRITFEDLMEYKRHDDLKRRAAADDLAELSEELDLY